MWLLSRLLRSKQNNYFRFPFEWRKVIPKMNWKFWKKDSDSKDETVLQVTDTVSTSGLYHHLDIYVKAQTNEKALNLFDELKKRKNEGLEVTQEK